MVAVEVVVPITMIILPLDGDKEVVVEVMLH